MTATEASPPRLALQLFTLRRLGLPFEALVATAGAAGYAGVELVGDPGLGPGEARRMLDAAGVTVCSNHVPLPALEEDPEAVASFNLALGNDVVVVPWLPPELRPRDRDGWQALGARLGLLGRELRPRGLRLLYHNHDFELLDVEGRTGLDWMLESAAPDDLGLEPDLGWLRRAGRDPERWLERHAQRCPRVHVKDVAAPADADTEGGWRDVGAGTLNWHRLLPACRRAGAEWLVVEHDEPSDPTGSARRSAAYLRYRLAARGEPAPTDLH